MIRRFEREAQNTANLRSVHTVEVYDFGITDSGTFYFVMELLAGIDLETLVNDVGALSPARTRYLMRQVYDSLLEAHEKGLVVAREAVTAAGESGDPDALAIALARSCWANLYCGKIAEAEEDILAADQLEGELAPLIKEWCINTDDSGFLVRLK